MLYQRPQTTCSILCRTVLCKRSRSHNSKIVPCTCVPCRKILTLKVPWASLRSEWRVLEATLCTIFQPSSCVLQCLTVVCVPPHTQLKISTGPHGTFDLCDSHTFKSVVNEIFCLHLCSLSDNCYFFFLQINVFCPSFFWKTWPALLHAAESVKEKGNSSIISKYLALNQNSLEKIE